MELIQIVDKNGNFTGQIMDKEEAHDKNLLHNEIAVFIISDNKQVLLQKRSANKRFNPNKWALCAGHVDADESLETAALRELQEEVGLDTSLEELHSFAERELTIRDSNSHITYFYYTKSNRPASDFIIQEEELSEVKWFDIDMVIDMIKMKDENIVFKENILYVFEALKKISEGCFMNIKHVDEELKPFENCDFCIDTQKGKGKARRL